MLSMEEIHIWEFPYKVSVLLNKEFIKKVVAKLKKRYGYLRIAHKEIFPTYNFSSFRNLLKPSIVIFRDLTLYVEICKKLSIPLKEMEKNILAYRTTRGRCTIEDPILPIKVTPLFDMIIAHIFGDGNSVKIAGRELYFNYRQFDKEYLDLFLEKLESVFGRIKYKNEYFYSINRIYLPTIISSVLANFYSLKSEDFLSRKCFIPNKLFTHHKNHLLAFLIGFVIDEGFIDSGQIVIALHNKRLIRDLGKICEKLGYSYTISDDKKIPAKSILYILEDGVKKFWEDYIALKKNYPQVYLGHKEGQIKEFILRKKKFWKSKEGGLTKNLILTLLKEKPRTIRELAKILLISRQGVRYHLKQLTKRKIVKRMEKGKMGSHTYILKKFREFPITKKGRSRQYGITEEKIIQLLVEFGNLDTKKISKKLRMRRISVYPILKKLEKEKKIVRKGKRIYRTHPTIIWGLV